MAKILSFGEDELGSIQSIISRVLSEVFFLFIIIIPFSNKQFCLLLRISSSFFDVSIEYFILVLVQSR